MVRTQTVTILFCDLVASTERRARLGDDAFDDFTDGFMAVLRDVIGRHHGQEVSSAGDGLMVVFPESTADAVTCAIDMHRSVGDLDPDDRPMLRVGISSGEVARDGDDYAGMPIVEAARLEALAAPGQTLANAIVRALVGTRRALRFREVGALSLKGIPLPLATVEVIDEEMADVPRPSSPQPKPRRRRPSKALLGMTVVALVVAVLAGLLALRPASDKKRSTPSVHASSLGVTAPKGYTPRYEPTSCPTDVREVAADATCGHLVVPQARSAPRNGKHVTLLVTRAPARLPGREGAPTIDLCGCENLGNSLARDHSELIHIGERGFEGTPILTCPGFVAARMNALTKRSDDPNEIARGTAALRRCHADLVARGIDPAQYNFVAAAQDVLDLMWVLKIQHANFVAFQLAGTEAFEVLRRAPGAVRSLTLEDPPPPGQSLLSDPVGDLSGAFGRFVALCEGDS
ncbi:MAG TPA: adenylate/guanylate cyclase domain-containing protein, partial [Acidimicrobiia bacterium]|nr:adenylate/guanylate cyclase domain-containing protein [Acidimicrobiia bacterium]